MIAGDQRDRTIKVMAPSGTTSDFQPFDFTFDRVFTPSHSQDDVFAEISQLVQSAMDGYKVGGPPGVKQQQLSVTGSQKRVEVARS